MIYKNTRKFFRLLKITKFETLRASLAQSVSTTTKCILSLVKNSSELYLKDKNLLRDKKYRSTSDLASEEIHEAAIFISLKNSKAFDRVQHHSLIIKFSEFELPDSLFR